MIAILPIFSVELPDCFLCFSELGFDPFDCFFSMACSWRWRCNSVGIGDARAACLLWWFLAGGG